MNASGIGAATRATQQQGGDDQRLRRAAAELEGVFLGELLKALRETVPEGGAIDGGQPGSIFTEMLDSHLANVAAVRQGRGLGEALYRQLRALLPADAPATSAEPGS